MTANTVTTKARALANLQARVPEFQAIAIKAMSQKTWDMLTVNQKAALTSLCYNYGRLPIRVYPGDPQRTAAAISGLRSSNSNSNIRATLQKRRAQEAAFYLKGPSHPATIPSAAGAAGAAGAAAAAQYLSLPSTYVLAAIAVAVLAGVIWLIVTRQKKAAPAAVLMPLERVNQLLDMRDDLDKEIAEAWQELNHDYDTTKARLQRPKPKE